MMTLYGFKGSGSAAVEAALQWTGAAHRIVEAASWEPGSAIEALKRVNPLAQIPTLVLADGTVLTESAAILIHLGLEHPASGLLPAGAAARAGAIRGLVYIGANCYAAIGVIDFPERVVGAEADESLRERVRAATRARLHALWDVFADGFVREDMPFLGGARPCALDLLAVVVSQWSGTRAHLRQARPAFAERLARIEQHPEVRPVFERHWPKAPA
jgi:GST-like protein